MSERLKELAGLGVSAAVLLREMGITVRDVADQAKVTYPTAWLVANEGTARGPKSRRVQEVIDKLLGFAYPWPKEER